MLALIIWRERKTGNSGITGDGRDKPHVIEEFFCGSDRQSLTVDLCSMSSFRSSLPIIPWPKDLEDRKCGGKGFTRRELPPDLWIQLLVLSYNILDVPSGITIKRRKVLREGVEGHQKGNQKTSRSFHHYPSIRSSAKLGGTSLIPL